MVKRRENYTLADLKVAVDAVRSGQMTCSRASKHFNIPNQTIRRHSLKDGSNKMGNPLRLNSSEETEIVKFVIECAESGNPATGREVINAAIKILRQKNGKHKTLSAKWYYGFLRRHPELGKQKTSKVSRENDDYKKEASENPKSNCRLCLESLENQTESKTVKGYLEMKINEIFPSNVLRLPTASSSSLCISCYAQVNDFHYFRSTIIQKHLNCEQFELCEIKMEQIDFNPVVNILAIKEEDLGDYEWNADDWNNEANTDINTECDQRELEIPQLSNDSENFSIEVDQGESNPQADHDFEEVLEEIRKGEVQIHQLQIDLDKALKAIDKGSFITDAALKFNISESHLKDFGDSSVSPQEFDRKIANWIITSGEMLDPKTKQNVLDAATHLSKLDSSTIPNEFNDSWFRSFLKRNPDVLLPNVLDWKPISDESTENLPHDKASDNLKNETDWIEEQAVNAGIKSFTEETMKLALEEIQNGAKICATARKYQIPNQTLSRRHKLGFTRKSKEPQIPRALETRLADWIVACNELGDTKKHSDICMIVSHIFKNQNRGSPSIVKAWVNRFLQHHPETAIEFQKSIYECDVCAKLFKIKFSLRNHFLAVHLKTKFEFKCKFCEKSFATIRSLKNHVLEQHPAAGKPKNFVCDVCGISFYTKKNLGVHAVHHKEKKFHCDFEGCVKKFLRPKELEGHKRNDHFGLKDFKCDFPGCDKGYNTKQKLIAHQKEKHEERAKCPINNCSFRVNRAAYMRNHLKRHTDIDDQELQEYLLIVKKMKLST